MVAGPNLRFYGHISDFAPRTNAQTLYFTYIATQSRNVLYQNWLFRGFKTQWPSSGNTTSFEGTPCRWSVLKNSRDCVYGTRKSCSPATTSVGVLYFPSAAAKVTGAHLRYASGFDHGVPCK